MSKLFIKYRSEYAGGRGVVKRGGRARGLFKRFWNRLNVQMVMVVTIVVAVG